MDSKIKIKGTGDHVYIVVKTTTGQDPWFEVEELADGSVVIRAHDANDNATVLATVDTAGRTEVMS